MKKIITLLFISIFTTSFAQTHRFFYELKIKKPNFTEEFNMVLDINKDDVKFYDYEFLPNDSIRVNTGKNLQAMTEIDQALIRNINSTDNKVFFSFGYDYFVISSTDKMDWKLENETKKIDNYILQKATTNFGGRTWTAWFAKDIPFQEGPYKFRGLSGLIFEVYDSENIFHYTLIKSANLPKTYDTTNFLETHYGQKPIAVSLKRFQKVKLNYYNNVVEDLNEFREKGGSIATENEMNSKEEIMQQKKSLQKNIKNYYVPLERDKAIPYPKD